MLFFCSILRNEHQSQLYMILSVLLLLLINIGVHLLLHARHLLLLLNHTILVSG